jgi:GNAT superfamily N-acetyltransferase
VTAPSPSALPSGLGPWCVGVRVVVRHLLPAGTDGADGAGATDVLGVLEEWGPTTVTLRREDGSTAVVDRSMIVAGKPVPPRPSPRLRVDVATAERRALAAWPPVESEELGDWVLRASGGFSARGNSALVLGDPGVPWAEAVDRVVAFYGERDLPAWVQSVTGSPEQERLLAEGWTTARPGEADTSFRLASVSRAVRAARALLPATTPTTTLHDRVSDAWLADDSRATAHVAAATAVLEGPADVAFLLVGGADGTAVAKGRAALSGHDWVGITDVWVSPDHRRRGLAATVVHGLLGWAAELGATTAYLQVRDDNHGALALYDRLGFSRHHGYRYLAPPADRR